MKKTFILLVVTIISSQLPVKSGEFAKTQRAATTSKSILAKTVSPFGIVAGASILGKCRLTQECNHDQFIAQRALHKPESTLRKTTVGLVTFSIPGFVTYQQSSNVYRLMQQRNHQQSIKKELAGGKSIYFPSKL